MQVLQEIGYDRQKPYIEVWNKMDLLNPEEAVIINDKLMQETEYQKIGISATKGTNVETLLNALYDTSIDVFGKETQTLKFHFSEHNKRSEWLF